MTSTDRRYFDEMYRASDDPWNFATSWYEGRKYRLTVESLPRERYERAFEPGCSIGILSERLAARCDQLLSTDIIDVAVTQASARVAHRDNVRVARLAVPDEWPDGSFDLIVLSELAYYFDSHALAVMLARVEASTVEGAHVVGVHWRGETNYPLTAHGAHDQIDATPLLRRIVHHEDPAFLLDVWERV